MWFVEKTCPKLLLFISHFWLYFIYFFLVLTKNSISDNQLSMRWFLRGACLLCLLSLFYSSKSHISAMTAQAKSFLLIFKLEWPQWLLRLILRFIFLENAPWLCALLLKRLSLLIRRRDFFFPISSFGDFFKRLRMLTSFFDGSGLLSQDAFCEGMIQDFCSNASGGRWFLLSLFLAFKWEDCGGSSLSDTHSGLRKTTTRPLKICLSISKMLSKS